MSLNIAHASIEDIQLIAEWQVAMALESESVRLDVATVLKGVARVFDDPRIGYYLLAYEGKKPVGCCLVLREWSDWRNGDVLWIHSVYTLPEYRRQGVFSAIYKFLEREVRHSQDLRGIRLYVDKKNIPARLTYESLGMNRDHYELYEWMRS